MATIGHVPQDGMVMIEQIFFFDFFVCLVKAGTKYIRDSIANGVIEPDMMSRLRIQAADISESKTVGSVGEK